MLAVSRNRGQVHRRVDFYHFVSDSVDAPGLSSVMVTSNGSVGWLSTRAYPSASASGRGVPRLASLSEERALGVFDSHAERFDEPWLIGVYVDHGDVEA